MNDTERELALQEAVFVPIPKLPVIPKRTALATIDVQYLDAHPDYGLGKRASDNGRADLLAPYFEAVRKAVVNIARLQDAARGVGIELIHIRIVPHTEDARECPPVTRMRKVRFPKSSQESAFLDETAPRGDEIALTKITSSAFTSTDLDLILRNMAIDTVIACGVVTNGCVESTVRDGRDRGFNMIVPSDACATWTSDMHERSLRYMAVSFGNVRTTDELVAEMNEAPLVSAR